MNNFAKYAGLMLSLSFSLVANAQSMRSVTDGYEDNLKGAQNIAALGPDLFGEQVNLKDGATSFRAVDVSLKTNAGLPMAVGRSLGINARDYDEYTDFIADGELFGNWKLDVPVMHGVFDERTGWITSMANPQQRCSVSSQYYAVPPDRASLFHNGANTFTSNQYWSGNQINIPGSGEENLLYLPPDRSRPADGRMYYGTTRSKWRVSCLPSLLNGTGEGFLVILPNGTKYYFNWLSSRKVSALKDTFCDGAAGGQGTCGSGMGMARREYFIHATRIEDRFGNWVTYQYDANNPRLLSSVNSSDGSTISVGYAGGKIATITTNNRTWNYEYVDSTRTVLSAVVQPDGSRWTFQYNNIQQMARSQTGLIWRDCEPVVQDQSVPPALGQSIVITHPSGAAGTFKFRKLNHGTDNTPGSCYDPNVDKFGDESVSDIASVYRIPSLYEKSVTGPGLSGQAWTYWYDVSWSWSGSGEIPPNCAIVSCDARTQTEVTGPDGTITRYSFGNDYWTNVGQLLEVHVIKNNVFWQSTINTFATAAGQPFPDQVGFDPNSRNNRLTSEKERPQRSTYVTRDGSGFNSYIDTFDDFARPLSVIKSSSQGNTKTDTTVYYNDLATWVLGQVSATFTNGIEVSRTDFNSSALPWRTYSFGQLQQTLGYYADGMLATVRDGRDSTTTLSNWKRGIPQNIAHSDSTTESAVVGDNGWIDSVTDENGTGYTTSYTYDQMGRLAGIIYPAGDTTAWLPTTLTFQAVGVDEYGLGAGHWKQTVSTGNARKITYFDALWRPVVEEAFDAANSVGTLSQTVKRYDPDGHLMYQSYPMRGLAGYAVPTQGIHTEYDPLDRVISVKQNSELGVLETTTAYPSGFQVRTTSPRSQSTTVSYAAYDQPSTDWPVAVTHPEGAYTYIVRDGLDKPKSLTRRNVDGSIAVSRHYVYDAHQRLCKTVEPETAATVMDYDAAGNVIWSASGLAVMSSATCDTNSVPAGAKVTRTYDPRNRLSTMVFPDGNGTQSWNYTLDGLPAVITTFNDKGTTSAVNAYTYNKRRLLTGESLHQSNPDYTWALGYGYNGQGNVASHTSPGLTVNYAPNALGQPTQAGAYATGVSYHANGAMAQFTYGNGIEHTLAQNSRGMPERSRDAYGGIAVHDDNYDYDQNGNVLAISDGLPGGRGNRDMTYDGLDRLTGTTSPMFGAANYGYDVLDNIRTVNVSGGSRARDHTYLYDSSLRLTNVTNTIGGASVIGLAYDGQGNLANKNGQAFRFDTGNRLREATNNEQYRYDGHGRRIQASHQTLDTIYSMYGSDGVLRYQQDYRALKIWNYVYLNGSLVARVSDVTPAMPSPIVSAPTISSNGAYTVNWSAVDGASRYRLEESVNSGAWVQVADNAGLSWGTSGKLNGTYRYRVRSCHLGCSAYPAASMVTVDLTPTGVPTLSAPAYNTIGSYAVSWSEVTYATRYELEEQVNSGLWTQIQNTASLSLGVAGKGSGTYGYRVRACKTNCAAWSATSTVAVQLPPVNPPSLNVPAQGLGGAYTVSWGTSAGATTYTLEENASGVWTEKYTGSALSQAFSGATAGSHTYRIKACNPAGCSGVSPSGTVQVIYAPTAAPTLTAPPQAPNGAYTASWTAIETATSYQLEESTNGGGVWALTHNIAATSASFAGKAGGSYNYRVKACNGAGCGPVSAAVGVEVFYAPTTAPTASVPAQSFNGAFTVSWTPVGGATSYQMEESTNDGVWTLLYNAAGISTTLSGKASGSYSYRVKACNGAGCGPTSAAVAVQVTYAPVTAPIVSAPSQSFNGAYAVSWTTVVGATSYQLEESANSAAWTLIHDATANSKTLSGKAAGNYGYRAKACNVAGCGPLSGTVTTNVVLAPTTAPTVVSPANVATSSYTVSWNAIAAAASYQLMERVNGGGFVLIADAAVTSTAISGKTNATYEYLARGCNVAGCGPWSGVVATVVNIPPPIPAIPGTLYAERYIDESGSVNQIVNDVSWSASSGASRYELQGQFGANPASIIYSGPELQYQRTGGGQHSYWVRACNVSGCSGWQGPVSP